MKLWDKYGTTLRKHADCHVCGDDEIGSHFDAAWCHRCGWRGMLHEHRAAKAAFMETAYKMDDGPRYGEDIEGLQRCR